MSYRNWLQIEHARQKTANEHKLADEACGRDWAKDGCQCAACRQERAYLGLASGNATRPTEANPYPKGRWS